MRVARFTRIIGLLSAFGLGLGSSCPAASVHDARGEALRLYDLGRYQEALPLFNQVLLQKPRDLDSRNKRACILIRMNQPALALVDLDIATRVSPFLANDAIQLNNQFTPDIHYRPPASLVSNYFLYAPVFTNRGIALMMLNRDDEALAAFQRSIAIRLMQNSGILIGSNPLDQHGWSAAYCGIGQIYHRKGDDEQALAAFDRAIHHFPTNPDAHVGRGEALVGLGQFDLAFKSYNEAIRLSPGHSRAFGYRALAFERVGNDDAAIADYDAAIRLDPTATTARRSRAALLSRLGRNDQAVPDLDAAIRLDPRASSAFKDRGGIYNRLGDHARALQDLDEAIRLDPKNSKAYQNRAAAYNGLGQYERAIRDCDEALKLDPTNAGALNNRGLALAAVGLNERARNDLTESIRLQPHQVPAYHNRAGANTKLGLFDEAAADYEEVLRRAPDFAPAATGLKLVRDLTRRRASRPTDELALLHDDPEAARRYVEQGNSHRASADWPGAISEYTRALDVDPKSADALAYRGWSRACAHEPGAEADARAWLDLKGWRDPFAPYMALLGILAARDAGHDSAALVFLDEALANAHPPDWPSPLFRYLKRTIPSMELLSTAGDAPDHQTEAHAVIGLDLLHRGERAAALEHLRWVRDHGHEQSIARDLVRETLRRIDSTPPNSPR